jgi:hypothetical protein
MIRATHTAIHAATSRCWITGRRQRTRPSLTTASSLLKWRNDCFRARHADIFEHQLIRAVHTATSHSIPFVRLITSSRTRSAPQRGGVGSVPGMGFIASSSMSEWQTIPGIHTNAPNQSLEPTADRCDVHDFMKQFTMLATLAAASGGSAPSR